MGKKMPKLRTEEFVRENIYEILQIKKGRWIINGPNDRVRGTLRRKYIELHFKTESLWSRYCSKRARMQHAEDFNTSIFGWLNKNYKHWRQASLTDLNQVLGVADAVLSNTKKNDLGKTHYCNDNCSSMKCPNRKKFLECGESCKTPDCTNKESLADFDWEELMHVKFISKNKGVGVVAAVDMPKGKFLGEVTGVALDEKAYEQLRADDNENSKDDKDDKELQDLGYRREEIG